MADRNRTTSESERDQIQHELIARACQYALWLALHAAQQIGWHDIAQAIMRLHASVGDRRAAIEAAS